jgi:hypothetical protein
VPSGSGSPTTSRPSEARPGPAGRGNALASPGVTGPGGPERAALGAAYASYLERHRDATYRAVESELGAQRPRDPALSFEPTQVRYFDRVARELQLTAQERQLYGTQGFVSIDHQQRYSMGSAYFAIYARDLPVLITTDSITHALHRSYDNILKNLEIYLFLPALEQALNAAHETLAKRSSELGSEPLRASAGDVDLYLTVAQSLLGGLGVDDSTPGLEAKPVASRFGQDAKTQDVLRQIAALKLQSPSQPTKIYGGLRAMDYSQFRPRGHYTESEQLKRYFRAMMWLGRADTAFILTPPHAKSSLEVDSQREARSAALMTLVLAESGALKSLGQLRAIVDFMVGSADNLTLEQMNGAMSKLGLTRPAQLADNTALDRLRNEVGSLGEQQIRSQVITSPLGGSERIPPPQVFQVFGQSFVVDSFALSKVVFDSIVFRGLKQQRMMPSGFDVMAMLGNNEAVRLLKPELEKWRYGANLLAVREALEQRTPQSWQADLYDSWLDALRALDDTPTGHMPQVMLREAWRRKQLQTQLASWSELRHDTLLYAKQSYTGYPTCGYPAGFVEPYPAFFDKLERFAKRGAELIATANLSLVAAPQAANDVRRGAVDFLQDFAEHMTFLGRLARKELAAQPFTSEEEDFLRRTIDKSGGGSGPPRYDGWYPRLIYGGDPDAWQPTIADVHTNPEGAKALQVGVGDVSFVVVAIDNEGDRAAYVGPVYTYYEFEQPVASRLTDQQWRDMLSEGKAPQQPAFTQAFRAKPAKRELPAAAPRRARQGPSEQRLLELNEQFSITTEPARRKQLYDQIEKLRADMARPPRSSTTPE